MYVIQNRNNLQPVEVFKVTVNLLGAFTRATAYVTKVTQKCDVPFPWPKIHLNIQ